MLILAIMSCGTVETKEIEKPIIDTFTLELARIINAECGICDDREKKLVGSVVLNRIGSDKFPNTIQEVISQDSQFAGYNSKHYIETDGCILIAEYLRWNGPIDKDILYFFNPRRATNTEFVNYYINRAVYKEKYHIYSR